MKFSDLLLATRKANDRQPGEEWHDFLQRTHYLAMQEWEQIPDSDKDMQDITKRTVPFHMPTAYPLIHTKESK